MTTVPLIDATEIAAALNRIGAVDAIEAALLDGVDIESDSPRLFSPLAGGEFLLMPSESPEHAGIKVVTIAPRNTERGLPKIQAWYLVFDADTLSPVAILDGAHLTTLRTPAVTAVAVRAMLRADPRGPRESIDALAVLGSGPQAEAHVRTLVDLLPVGAVRVLGRSDARVADMVHRLQADGIDAAAGDRRDLPVADVVITATSSAEPVLERRDVSDRAVVAAIGSHGVDHRELAADLVADSDLVVEARASAFRENGNLLAARDLASWQAGAQTVSNLRELVAGSFLRREGHPAVYTGVGMSWEDLAVVASILRSVTNAAEASSGGNRDVRK
ncbi:ornithine cyclodeaminase family protein [Microbacterium sp.]|uniref:ornithine cyclodeaminase family protein n=1 Tax=Microbacterium sp. TaxID=51671 RepID=UPI002736EB57|nr:ornithine cyclodeaminase family protein [Microbacterium sp.]MDP3951703.1 ornithine cyclodeaminase family protein [Microbacterium sp.]